MTNKTRNKTKFKIKIKRIIKTNKGGSETVIVN